jgi:hypothetical protein
MHGRDVAADEATVSRLWAAALAAAPRSRPTPPAVPMTVLFHAADDPAWVPPPPRGQKTPLDD